MIDIYPYEAKHGDSIIILKVLGDDSNKYTSALNYPGMSFTAMKDGEILGCAGIVPIWSGVGEAWTMLSGRLREEFSLTLHREVKKRMLEIAKENKLHRLYCNVQSDFDAGHRWALILGFKHEGKMPWFGPDKKDFDRYGMILEEV